MTRDQLFDALSAMPQGQFDLVLGKLAVPPAYVPGPQAAQGTRATELLRWVEQQNKLAELEALLKTAPASTAGGQLRRHRALILMAGLALLGVGGFTRWWRLRRPPEGIKLIWSPSDCERKEPRIGYGSCNETRELPWLQSQINGLRHARARGFDGLRLDPTLQPTASGKNENWLLYLESAGRRFIVGVGYDRDTRSKDGCLHLYDPQDSSFQSATACLDANGHWWASDGWLGTYRRIDPASPRRP